MVCHLAELRKAEMRLWYRDRMGLASLEVLLLLQVMAMNLLATVWKKGIKEKGLGHHLQVL